MASIDEGDERRDSPNPVASYAANRWEMARQHDGPEILDATEAMQHARG